MVAVRALLLTAALAAACAHLPSHDNILRIQLWDAEGLTREPVTSPPARKKLKVNLDSLYKAMLEEDGGEVGRFTRHKVRHKRRRPRELQEKPWRFHDGNASLNVVEYEGDEPPDLWSLDSVVSGSVPVNERPVEPPKAYRQEQIWTSGSWKVVEVKECKPFQGNTF